jgi:outer membrane protein assembly factor BamA
VLRRFPSGVDIPDTLVPKYTKTVETFTTGWDTRDSPLVTRRGHFLGGTIAESGAFYGATYRWWRTTLQAKVWVPEGRVWVLAGKAEMGAMGPLFQSPRTPIDERFKIGGPGTVRGWGRELLSPRASDNTPVGGDFMFDATTEVRRNVWGPVVIATFIDVGNVWKDYRYAKLFDVYPSAGAGLMMITPVGPVRVDYGYQLRPNPYGERRWAIHLSLGSPF